MSPAPTGLPEHLANANRTLVMGVLNITPDSFSDGGKWFDSTTAIAHGTELIQSGADIIDVGGESTRPGSLRIPVAEELARVLPAITELASTGAVISIDTTRAEVAAQAVAAGALLINDVSGGLADPQMAEVAAQTEAIFVISHWRGHSARMYENASYGDVVVEVCAELSQSVEAALRAGVEQDKIVLDPGLGFAKGPEHNWELLRNYQRLADLGFPLLIGASRKRFLAELLTEQWQNDLQSRDDATAAVSALVAQQGAWGVRVHEPASSAAAVRVVGKWQSSPNLTTQESTQ